MDRKHNLRRDFERYYAEVLGQKEFSFAEVKKQGKKRIPRLSEAEERIIREADELGWQGKTLPIDAADIEDQNALLFTETLNGKKRTVLKLKARPDTDARIVKTAGKGKPPSLTPEPLPEDEFFDNILPAIKTVSYHAGDGEYNMNTINTIRKKLLDLQHLKITSDDSRLKEMAEHYIKWINEIESAIKEKRKINGDFMQYLPPGKKTKTEKGLGYVTKKGKVQNTRRKIGGGEVNVLDDGADNSTMFKGAQMPEGEQFTLAFDDGTRVRYTPWSKKNLYAQRGEIEIVVDGGMTPEKVNAMLEKLEKLGLDASVASPENTELMYLQKMAYIRKSEQDDDYKKMMRLFDDRDASINERIQGLRGYWEKKLGVKDITKQPGYNPQGDYQIGFLDRNRQGGYRHQYRFDITEEELEKEMKGYALYHNLTDGGNLKEFIDLVMENNGAMVSTVEKMRMGIPPGGMSPIADMNSGGATYFFTRIRKVGSSPDPGLYFKKQMLRRMDAISYNHDAYGKVIDDYVWQNRKSTFKEWKGNAQESGNETIFKYSVTLLDNLEAIVTHSAAERKAVIRSFTKNGVTELPDGRKIEEVVR